MSFARFDLLRRVNAEVNADTRYMDDVALYGTDEFWKVAAGLGDCEDYALAKRARLLAEGVPLEDLRLAVVYTETPEGQAHLAIRKGAGRAADEWMGDHAVLIATDHEHGDFLLDNRFPDLVRLKDTGYTIDRLQVAGRAAWEHGKDFA